MMIFVIGIVFAVVGVFMYLRTQADRGQKLPVAYIRVGRTPFVVEVASTYMQRGQGLSGHAPLGKNDGMLFVFSSPSAGAFWMRDMLYPIDFIWIKGDRVVGVTENAPRMSVSDHKLYYPPIPVDRVLEVNAGSVKYFGITAGDAVY